MTAHHPRGPALSLIIMPILACNARCDYCFVPDRAELKSMTEEQAHLVLSRALDYMESRGIHTLLVYWQGGEAMLRKPAFYRAICEQSVERFARAGKQVVHHMQTNLLLYDREWASVLRECFGGRVGTSLDYPNLHRWTPTIPRERYEAEWLERMRMAKDDGITVGPICVLNEGAIAMGGERYYHHFVHEIGVLQLQINTPFPGSVDDATLPAARDVGQFMVDLYHAWRADRDATGASIAPLRAFERLFEEGAASDIPCVFSRSCAASFVSVRPDGSVSLCDYWASSQPDHAFGNLYEQPLEEIMRSPERARFLARPARVAGVECRDCPYLAACHGGCPTRTYTTQGTLYARDYYCDANRMLFEAIERSVTLSASAPTGGG